MTVASHAPTSADGLTTTEAARLLAEHGPNVVAADHRVPLWARVAAQLRDPLIMVLLGAVALTLAIGDHPDAVVIALVIVVNTTVGVVQEVRAESAVAALSRLSAPAARVLRDGEQRKVPSAELVPGDVVALAEGDVVPADARLIESAALLVDESMLTGESLPVAKAVEAERPADGVVQAGTVVLRGRALSVVTATGAASALGRIAALLRPRPEPTPLQRRLAGLGRVLAAVAVGLCAVVFVLGLLRHQPPGEMGVTAISLAVAAVPESLPAVVTLALALGARRMATRHAVVRRLPAVETLGSVTVLATDKTGTLTQGRMVVERLWSPHSAATVTGLGYGPAGELRLDGAADDELKDLLTAAALCNDAALRPPTGEDGEWGALGDPTEAALLTAAGKAGLDYERLRETFPRVAETPFDSARKLMSTVHRAPDGSLLACLKGAPEAVLDPAVLAEPPELLEKTRRAAARLATEGSRVLAVAERRLDHLPEPPEEAEQGLKLLGLTALADPPRSSAAATLAACRRAGITPVLVTGDHPATARALAVRIGLLEPSAGPEAVVNGQALAAGEVTDLTRARVFARTDPRQKLDIVQAWRARDAVTAMTGDGVNDGPALRQADIGVAMGRRGTEVARQAADLVLADDELATVVSAVEEGRRVYDNIRRFLVYGLAGGAAEILVMLAGPLFGLALPLRAGQILWINLLTHGLTGVAMGAEPASPGAMARPPRPPHQHILGSGVWQRVLLLGLVVAAVALGAALWARNGERPWQTVLFLALLAAQLGTVLGLRERLLTRANPFLPAAVLASAALAAAALYLPFLREVLDTAPLSPADLAAPAAAGLAGFAAARLCKQGI
ncbi:HAD-IC family P-type ATPase [Streptomyces kaniharaensis]|uniref:HAD-IC family P-type ATPase n=1 Tax=Streptomyces kaniharaensis TaxID=212423 RepID=A0A6N7KZR8_9ACTN|nr:HAD-IC family P-type ATPase [Streptomyces kaniharaensis]MQS17132.1 HAD-IC family P-type ATPase [Streptomyces kaniharaensis]